MAIPLLIEDYLFIKLGDFIFSPLWDNGRGEANADYWSCFIILLNTLLFLGTGGGTGICGWGCYYFYTRLVAVIFVIAEALDIFTQGAWLV